MKSLLLQRKIWTILVIFQALSIGNTENNKNDVKQVEDSNFKWKKAFFLLDLSLYVWFLALN
jgi:hypothetical protein